MRRKPISTRASSPESAIWGRLFGPEGTSLSLEAARGFLAIDFPQADKDRQRELAARARQGTLSPEEQEEIDAYGRIGSFLSVMKSKARVALRNAQADSSGS
jgi:hypothetical protein